MKCIIAKVSDMEFIVWVLLVFSREGVEVRDCIDCRTRADCTRIAELYDNAKCIETRGWPGQMRPEWSNVGRNVSREAD